MYILKAGNQEAENNQNHEYRAHADQRVKRCLLGNLPGAVDRIQGGRNDHIVLIVLEAHAHVMLFKLVNRGIGKVPVGVLRGALVLLHAHVSAKLVQVGRVGAEHA